MANVSKHLKDLTGNRVYPKTIFSDVFKNENEKITLTDALQRKFDIYAFAGYEEGGSHIVESDYADFQECSKGSYIYDVRTECLYEVTATVPQGSLWTNSVVMIHLGDEISQLNSDIAVINNRFSYYNANTDRTVDANRKAALDYLSSNYGTGIYCVRYSSGYYYMYLLTKTTVPTNDAYAVEFTYIGNINLFRHEAGAWSITNLV